MWKEKVGAQELQESLIIHSLASLAKYRNYFVIKNQHAFNSPSLIIFNFINYAFKVHTALFLSMQYTGY